jgi:dipeptidyl aminopeptidase/acylaminoacyl peptidase
MLGTRTGRNQVALAIAVAVCVLTGCTAQPSTTLPAPPVPSPDSQPTLRTLADTDFAGTPLELGAVTAETEDYTTTAVTYASGGTTTTGALSIPATGGPHPGLVLVHGVVSPDVFVPGTGLSREQDYFAKSGYVVLNLDLRSSTAEPTSAAALGIDLGSTIDVINGVQALRSAGIPTLDESRIGLLGHSLGGLLALNTIAAKPDLVDAAVALAPASIDPSDNVDYLTALFGGTPAPIVERYGTPADNPQFWRDMSPGSLVEQAEAPLLIIHGTADEITPFSWSETTAAVWEEAGKDVELVALEDEGHVFQARWNETMTLATDFLTRELAG